VVLESDCLDEIDPEWIGGNAGSVQSNYFGKGNTTSYNRAVWSNVAGAQSETHNYTVDWRSDGTDWYIDSALVRSLQYADAVGGKNYPQTPMRLKIGIWAGGDTSANSEGTVTWAGGATDFSQGPFSMMVEKVEITNRNPAGSYKYGNQTGDWQSIQLDGASDSSNSASASVSAGGPLPSAVAMTEGENGTMTVTKQDASTSAAVALGDTLAVQAKLSTLVFFVTFVAVTLQVLVTV